MKTGGQAQYRRTWYSNCWAWSSLANLYSSLKLCAYNRLTYFASGFHFTRTITIKKRFRRRASRMKVWGGGQRYQNGESFAGALFLFMQCDILLEHSFKITIHTLTLGNTSCPQLKKIRRPSVVSIFSALHAEFSMYKATELFQRAEKQRT
jgi:hypothetical protein